MTCEEAQNAIRAFIRSLPPIEHEYDNISVCDDREEYICRHCMDRKTVIITQSNDEAAK